MEYLKYTAKTLPHVILTGKVYVPENNCHFKRKPCEYILYFVTKGKMTILEDKVTYNLKKGDLLILDPTHTHSGKTVDSEVEYYYIHFNSSEISIIDSQQENIHEYILQNKLDNSSEDTLIIPKYLSGTSNYAQIQNMIFLLVSSFPCKSDLYKTTGAIRLMDILVSISMGAAEASIENPGKNNLVINLISYIHENCHRNINSQEIEDHFNMNFDHLNRIFKSKTNTTIINYSNKYRISESKKLLNSGLYNVKQTAEQMGFSNEFYFSRVYKKYEGVSPSEIAKGFN